MNTPYLDRRRELFQHASELPAAERMGFLEQACAGDTKLLDDVRSLLEAADDEEFLARPAADEVARHSHLDRSRRPHDGGDRRDRASGLPAGDLAAGSRIASYTILRVLGSGGMGVVYAAQQDSPRREVALKVILPGLIAPTLLRRFTHEAHALGLLQHPGIARVYEAGTEGAGPTLRPYLAMELVRGLSLAEFVAQRRPDTGARLELFAKVCDAVHHAHQRGVIHRDLKPANILVESEPAGSPPQPKILDFGVARILSADANVTTMQTAAGQMIGTPAYMSPEQVSGDPDATDVRSDVYSLGVILFELLSGKLPHDLTGKPLAEAARIIRDEEPSRLTAVSRTYRGDLDVIVSKALAKQKNRRYDSAAELAADVRRYLAGEAILARRDSAMYILSRTVRRYRFAFAAAAAFVVLLGAFTVMAALSAQANRRLARDEALARRAAELSSERAQSAADDARREAERADSELRLSTIERGRLLGLSADRAAGESLLWGEHLRSPNSADTLWALREFYMRNPCRAAVKTPAIGPWSLVVQPPGHGRRAALIAVAGESDGRVFLHDSETGALVHTIDSGSTIVSTLAFGPDPRLLYIGTLPGCLSLWSVDASEPSPRLIRSVDAPHVRQMRVACSPDGRWLCTFDYVGQFAFWQADSLDRLTTINTSTRVAQAAVFSPDSAHLFAACSGGRVAKFSMPPFLPPAITPVQRTDLASIAISPDGSLLATGATGSSIVLSDAATLEPLALQSVHSGTVRTLDFLDGGLSLMSSSWWSADLWNIANPSRPLLDASFSGGPAPFVRSQVSPDRSTLISAHNDGLLRFWDLAPERAFTELRPHPDTRLRRAAPAVSPDGTTIALLTSEGVDLLDLRQQAFTRRLARPRGVPARATFNAAGTWLASAVSGQHSIAAWDLSSDGPPISFETPPQAGYIHQVRISPDGSRAAASYDGGLIRVWDLRTREPTADHHVGTRVPGLEFSPDGKVVYGASSRWVVAVDSITGQLLRKVTGEPHAPYSLGVSRDGSLLGTGEWNRTIGLYDARTLTRIATLAGHSGIPWSIRFSPDGRSLLSGGDDGRIKLWDIASGRNLFTLDAAEDRIQAADFADGDRRMVFMDRHGQSRMFDTGYFDRHIAGNAEHQLSSVWPELTPEQRTAAVNWVSRLLGRPAVIPESTTPIDPGLEPLEPEPPR